MDGIKESDDISRHQMLAEFEQRVIKKDDDWYYSDSEYVTNSMLGELSKSPEHLELYLKTKGQVQDQEEEKKAFIEGRAFDVATLQPNLFEKQFCVLDDTVICSQIGGAKPRGTNRYKEWKEDFMSANQDKDFLDMEAFYNIQTMRDKIYSNSEIRNLLEISLKQVIMHDEITIEMGFKPIKRKIKMDCVRPGDFILDLKGTRDASSQFLKSFYNYGYDRQGAYYSDVAKIENVLFLHVEKTKPYSIGLVRMSENTLEVGREKYMSLLKEYHKYFIRREIPDLSQFVLKRTV